MNEHDFNHKISVNLDHSVNSLDAETRQQLANRRQHALGSQQVKNPLGWLSADYWRQFWMPAGALAFSAILGVFALLHLQQSDRAINIANNGVANPAAVLEVLNNPEDLDVISDPDFYAWSEETLNAEKTPNHKDSANAG